MFSIYWGQIVLIATYLVNKLSTCILNGISLIESPLFFVPSSSQKSSLFSQVFGLLFDRKRYLNNTVF